MPSLKSINSFLDESAKLIDKAADQMKSMDVEGKEKYVLQIANVLNQIHDVQREFYKIDSSLEPEFLREEVKFSIDNKEYGVVLLESKELEAQGDVTGALSMVEDFLKIERPEHLRVSALKLIQQIQSKCM